MQGVISATACGRSPQRGRLAGQASGHSSVGWADRRVCLLRRLKLRRPASRHPQTHLGSPIGSRYGWLKTGGQSDAMLELGEGSRPRLAGVKAALEWQHQSVVVMVRTSRSGERHELITRTGDKLPDQSIEMVLMARKGIELQTAVPGPLRAARLARDQAIKQPSHETQRPWVYLDFKRSGDAKTAKS